MLLLSLYSFLAGFFLLLLSLSITTLPIVHGKRFPIILFQSILTNKYTAITTDAQLIITQMMIPWKLMLPVASDIIRSIAGLPSKIPIQIIASLYSNSPAKIADANFHGLYLDKPKVM